MHPESDTEPDTPDSTGSKYPVTINQAFGRWLDDLRKQWSGKLDEPLAE